MKTKSLRILRKSCQLTDEMVRLISVARQISVWVLCVCVPPMAIQAAAQLSTCDKRRFALERWMNGNAFNANDLDIFGGVSSLLTISWLLPVFHTMINWSRVSLRNFFRSIVALVESLRLSQSSFVIWSELFFNLNQLFRVLVLWSWVNVCRAHNSDAIKPYCEMVKFSPRA